MNVDRVNVGFAALEMNKALGFSPQVFGLGAGLFFIGYALFEVPSNMILHRVGVKIWIARIMITWGLISAATAFVSGATQFYIIRVLLGIAEAGFVPGMMLYFTYWFPANMRARVVACMVIGSPVGSIIMSPLSGWLLGANWLGLAGWQWMFILEAMPAVLLGLAVFFVLPRDPSSAVWLTEEQKRALKDALAEEKLALGESVKHSFWEGISDPRVIVFILANLLWTSGFYGSSIWLPLIIKSFGFSNIQVGFLNVLPAVASVVAMIIWSWNSDRTGERLWHLAVGALLGGGGLAVSAYFVTQPVVSLLAILVATFGMFGWAAVFWTVPQTFLSGRAAASGLAVISALGSLGGFFGPNLVGGLKSILGSFQYSLFALALCLILAAIVVLVFGAVYREDIRKARAAATSKLVG